MINSLIDRVFSEKAKKTSERLIINIAIVSFMLHLAVIFANDLGWLTVAQNNSLFTNS